MQRFRAFCKRYAGWILITLALLLCQRWWIARNRPQRLLELPEGYAFTRLHDGVIILQKSVQPSFQKDVTRVRRPGSSRLIPVMTLDKTPFVPALFTMPVTGGPLRPLPPGSIEATSSYALLTSGAGTYRIEYRKTPGIVGIPPGYNRNIGTASGGFIVSSTPAPPPPKPKPPFHTLAYRDEADALTAILRRVSTSGVSSSETIACPMGYVSKYLIANPDWIPSLLKSKIAFSGNAVYWLKGFPDESTYRISSNGQIVGNYVFKYRSAVMTMPLRGGTTRKLLDNVPSDARLLATEDSVLCGINAGSRAGWLRLHPDGTSQQVLTTYSQFDDPVEGNHCLYWVQDQWAKGVRSIQVMQVSADGSGQRVLYTASSDPKVDEVKMQEWHGQVFFRVRNQAIPGPTADVSKSTLYRVNPALPSGVERLCALPDNTASWWFEGDYVYCLAREEKTGLMNTFRANSLPEVREVLYRYRLPAP